MFKENPAKNSGVFLYLKKMSNFSYTYTFLLIFLYIVVFLYFYIKDHDSFFLRPKSYRKLDMMITLTFLTSFLFILWNSLFYEFKFLGLKISHETVFFNDKFVTFLGIALAVIGWVYTLRSQLITNMKNHSIQTIMSSRLSESYNEKFDNIYKILENTKSLSIEHYKSLSSEHKSVVHYILNYYESVAIGIRYNEFDEDIIKSMALSQVRTTHDTFKEVIQHLTNDSPTYFQHYRALYERWKNN